MRQSIEPITLVLMIVNLIITYQGLARREFLDRLSFNIGAIRQNKQYYRFISSGFLHVDWSHFIFNIMTLYFFGGPLARAVGPGAYMIIYFGSLVGGNLLAYAFNKNSYNYSAVGASGAISGLLTAYSILNPSAMILIFFVLPMPIVLYTFVYSVYTIFGISNKRDNVGHEAHLGGGIVGALITAGLTLLATNFEWTTLRVLALAAVTVPSIVFFVIVYKKPIWYTKMQLGIKRTPNQKKGEQGWETIDDKYNTERLTKEEELNKLLDKVSKKGIEGLSSKERARLRELSE